MTMSSPAAVLVALTALAPWCLHAQARSPGSGAHAQCRDKEPKLQASTWVRQHPKYRGPVPYVDADSLDSRPQRLAGPTPEYPTQVRLAGYEGTVFVEGVVEPDGRMRFLEILGTDVTSPPFPSRSDSITVVDARWAFQQAATVAVRNSVFHPGEKDGQPVAVLVCIPIDFHLRQ
jgi:hypothetical protein